MAQISVALNINSELLIKDPQETDLGRRIVQEGIVLIDEIGFEVFTFKKLADRIHSTEASIYRYFKNKHLFFVYLINWYWEWTSFRISFNTMNLNNPEDKLRQIIHTIVDTSQKRASIEFVDTDILHRIVVAEGTKAYHGKSVDRQNKKGFFLSYKDLCAKIAQVMQEVNPTYPYTKALASTLIETANNNIYFAEHLPRLTDVTFHPNFHADIEKMLVNMIFCCLNCPTAASSKKNGKPYLNGSSGH